MEIVFLGTSSMVPTKERNHSGIFLSYENVGMLVDCGEGTQRQLKIAGIRPSKVNKILITHWHGDHTLGVPGLLQTLGKSEYEDTLEIYGPKGTKKIIDGIFEMYVLEEKLDYKVKDIDENVFFKSDSYKLEALEMDHRIKCLGFSFVENEKRKILTDKIKKFGVPFGPMIGKLQSGLSVTYKGKTIKPDDVSERVKGRKISILGDTRPCNNAVKLAEDADIMICEATYLHDLLDKAEEFKHMTAREAALLAHKANAKKLILTHFSQRYKDTDLIRQEAKEFFNNVECAYDFMDVKV